VSVKILGSNKRFVSLLCDVCCCVSGTVCGVTAIVGTTCLTCCNWASVEAGFVNILGTACSISNECQWRAWDGTVNNRALLTVKSPPTFRVLSIYDASQDFCRRGYKPCWILSKVEFVPIAAAAAKSAIDVLEWDWANCDNGWTVDVEEVFVVDGTIIGRCLTGHRPRTSSTTLINAAKYGTDVRVTLNLSWDSDLATILRSVDKTRVVRTTVDWTDHDIVAPSADTTPSDLDFAVPSTKMTPFGLDFLNTWIVEVRFQRLHM
jgi:hypothetical protein